MISLSVYAQDESNDTEMEQDIYYQIPDYPEEYTEFTVAARLIDGLGYRYYWATEGLRDEDIAFKPNDDARNVGETIDHIFGLTRTIANACQNLPNIRSQDNEEFDFEAKRKATLENIKLASDVLKSYEGKDMNELKIIFKRGENTSEFPFWNLINGPIADALWHAGQIVSFRRSSGNPLDPNVSVFRGKNRS